MTDLCQWCKRPWAGDYVPDDKTDYHHESDCAEMAVAAEREACLGDIERAFGEHPWKPRARTVMEMCIAMVRRAVRARGKP